MQQRCAVLPSVEADADLLCRILIQRRLDRLQRGHDLLTQRCACGGTRSTDAFYRVEIILHCNVHTHIFYFTAVGQCVDLS